MEIVIALLIVAGLAIYLFSRRREVDEAPAAETTVAPYKVEQSVVLESTPVVVEPVVVEPVVAAVSTPAKQPRQPRKPAAKPAAKKPAAIQAAKKPRTPRAK